MSPELDGSLSGVPSSIVRPHILLPSQHRGGHPPDRPELRLMAAVVEDAIHCVEKYRCATDHRGRRLCNEATRWFRAREPRWPYSFESICEVLRLNAGAVRRALGVTHAQPPVLAPHRVQTARQATQAPVTADDASLEAPTCLTPSRMSHPLVVRAPNRIYPLNTGRRTAAAAHHTLASNTHPVPSPGPNHEEVPSVLQPPSMRRLRSRAMSRV